MYAVVNELLYIYNYCVLELERSCDESERG